MKAGKRLILAVAGMLLACATQAALVGEWKFEGGSATNSASTGSAYDGTVVGSPASVSGVEAGTDAFEFGGNSGNYISIPAAAFTGIGNEISISMWTFGDAALGVSAQCSAFGCNSRNMLHSHTPWSNGALYWDAGNVRHNYIITDSTKYKGKWNHIVYTMNAATGDKKVYINGVQDSPSWNSSLSAISGITHFYIGRAGHDSRTYYGKLDEFQLYDHALASNEVANLYASYTVDAYATAIISPSDTSGAAPLEVVFDGSGSTASGTITSYDWDFGDGHTASGALVTNTFAAGSYTSELVIATSEGLYSTSTVEIAAFNYVGADLAIAVEGSTESNLPSFYTDDLGQTSFANISGEGTGSASSGTQPEKLFNGDIGDDSSAIGSFVRINNSSSVTIEFDLSVNTLGYDITELSTIFGWNPAAGGRANQGYGVTATYVDDSQAILIDPADWAPNSPAFFWTKVVMTETNGLPMARGVKAITWNNFSNANAGGDVVGREFDILGTPTTEDYVFAGIAASTLEGPPPLEVAFDGSSSYSSTGIVSYAWDFGDGNVDAGAVVTNTYSTSGNYTAQLIVGDENGLFATNTVAIDVYDYVTAEASASIVSGVLPLEVVFEGTNSSSSGTITSYAWDFGDGNSASGPVVTNTYYLSGLYTATLTVTDSNGLEDSSTIDLSVSKTLNVNYAQYSEQIVSGTIPVVSSNDLAQTEYLSSEGTGGNEASQHAQLFNGVVGNQDGDTNDDGEVRLTSGEAIKVTFDTSVNTNGYDINMIETFAGWTPTTYDGVSATNNLSRSNQGYEIIVGFTDGSFGTMAGPTHWEPNGEATWTNSVGTDVNDTYWTKVGFTNVTGGAMLSNVEWIMFDISNNARAGGVVIYREFDVFGVPSTGSYPSEIVIGPYDGGDSLSWASDSTYNYSVQTNLNLVFGDWGTFTNVTGTPPETTVVLPPKNGDKMFYRVIVE